MSLEIYSISRRWWYIASQCEIIPHDIIGLSWKVARTMASYNSISCGLCAMNETSMIINKAKCIFVNFHSFLVFIYEKKTTLILYVVCTNITLKQEIKWHPGLVDSPIKLVEDMMKAWFHTIIYITSTLT